MSTTCVYPTPSELSPVESFREFRDNGLKLDGPSTGLESIHDYEPGGHHPVHLGDLLNDRYRVLNKLGSGNHSNVWLCRDLKQQHYQYHAVKIIMADASIKDCPELRVYHLLERVFADSEAAALVCLPVDQFDIQGPNGHHYAIVYPVLGPPAARGKHVDRKGDNGRELRQMCFHAVSAMATLHSYGTCHGDFRPANVLVRVKGLAESSEAQIIQATGTPKSTKVVRQLDSQSSWPPTAPEHLYAPIDWDVIDCADSQHSIELDTANVCIAHFAESFDMGDVPEDLGIPQEYRPPEYMLSKRVGVESDIWALGCTLFEIRTGRKLFELPHDDPDEHLAEMVKILGKFPEPWWSTTWEARRRWFGDVGSDQKVPSDNHYGTSNGVELDEPSLNEGALERCVAGGPRHLPSAREQALFADLLRRVLCYDPGRRLSPEEILQHPWFLM